MDVPKFINQHTNELIYSILLAVIVYLIYQLNFKDYTPAQEYFSADIPLIRSMPPEVIININNFQFGPDYVIIPVNTIVKWINLDRGMDKNYQYKPRVHSIVDQNHSIFESPDLFVNQSYTYRFNRPGTYYYYCSHYPKMTGTIVVVEETLM